MMLSFLVKQYIKKRAKASNLTYPKDIEDILGKEIQEYATSKRIVFSWLWDGGGKVPNASATIPGIIFINAEWAARIVLFPDNEDMHNAFRLTMGHEFTHQENDYFFLEPFTKNEKFVYWVNEKGRRMVNTCKQNRELALLDMRENGEIKGRPTAEQTVREWQEQNPNGTKSDCIRATGLNKKTVYKWWEVRNEEN